jgi:hypothetical protein
MMRGIQTRKYAQDSEKMMNCARSLVYMVVTGTLAAGCSGGALVGKQRVPYADLCNDARPDCRAYGDASVVMQDDRPLFDGDPKSYLASLVVTTDVRQPRDTCAVPITDGDYNTFTHNVAITILKEKELRVQVSAAIKAALATTQLKDAPGVEASLSLNVTSKLREQNYLNIEYNQYILKDAVLIRIRDGAHGTPESGCRAKLSSSPNRGFVWSVVTLTANTKMSRNVKDAVALVVDATLKNVTVNGGPKADRILSART